MFEESLVFGGIDEVKLLPPADVAVNGIVLNSDLSVSIKITSDADLDQVFFNLALNNGFVEAWDSDITSNTPFVFDIKPLNFVEGNNEVEVCVATWEEESDYSDNCMSIVLE